MQKIFIIKYMTKLFENLLASSSAGRQGALPPPIQQRRGIEIKSAREVEIMRRSGQIVAMVHSEINSSYVRFQSVSIDKTITK